ncbi:DUF3473 domain-containing protein [Planctomycetota bacterium]
MVSNSKITNALSIDVEDYWSILSRDWLHIDSEPSNAVVTNTEYFLRTLGEYGVKATFFVLGEVAEKFPSLIKKIAQDGHEIGSHGVSHKQIFKIGEEQFRQEISESKKMLEDIIGTAVKGYRAPAFSMMPKTKWALEILAQEGFEYDSSVYPTSGRRYGWPGFSKDICKVDLPNGESIIEVPMSTVTILGKTLPTAGGGYLRHFPYVITKWAIKRIQKKRPVIVYMHPYEIDVDERVFSTDHLSIDERDKVVKLHKWQLRNRGSVPGKLNNLLSEFKFAPLKDVISTVLKAKTALKKVSFANKSQ